MPFDILQPAAEQPAYRAAEASAILGVPQATVHAWCFGHDYRHWLDGRPRRFASAIVVESRFRAGDTIAEMAADYGVSAPDVEEALRFEHRRSA